MKSRAIMKKFYLLMGFALLLAARILADAGLRSDGLPSDDHRSENHRHFDSNEKLGTVSFPTSCTHSVQNSFVRGVALLHSFAYEEADQQFQKIAKADPQCAMAYWGQAMSL